MRVLSLVALSFAAACGSSGSAAMVPFTIALSDGRSCRDAGVVTLMVARGAHGYGDFVCEDAEDGRDVTVPSLPLDDAVSVLGLSAEGASLYAGSFTAADELAATPPPVVELYPDAAR